MDDMAELFLRVGLGDADAVREMLRFRPELARARDGSGLSVLQFARYMGEETILDALLSAGPALDIFEAAALDRNAMVRALVSREPALTGARDAQGWSALHHAAAHDAVRAAADLLGSGWPVDANTGEGSATTPLHAAVIAGAVEACRLLLRSGADPNARRGGGETPLMLAGARGSREIVEMLVARNANCEWRDRRGRTAADYATEAGHLMLAARLRLGERVVDRGKG